MAVSVPASPSVSSYFDTELPDHQSKLFPDDSMSIGLFTTFGEDDSNTSFGSWPDSYSCSEVSSFPSADSFTSLLNSPPAAAVIPSEEDLNLDIDGTSEFLQQHRCYGPRGMVSTPDSSVEKYIAPENHFCPQQQHSEQFVAEKISHSARAPQLRFVMDKDSPCLEEVSRAPQLHSLKGEKDDSPEQSRSEYDNFVDGRTHVELPDCFQVSNDDASLTTSLEEEPEEADGVHIPPPLNMKRLEMYDDAYYESIEAAEVPLHVIENKRPFQCGLAGCNKTFRNPQTMKMHHKTHFTDGSATDALLPTLTATAGTAWMAGRNKKIPSRCPKCRKTFVGLYELRRHYGRKHSEGERPFQCRKCDKRFYIEVDVRDHEKLCGEQIECKCGLTFAFKCNMVAHKKAHPACQDPKQPNQISTSVSINATSNNSGNPGNNPGHSNDSGNNSGYQSTVSDEDSTVSRWISPRTLPSLRLPGTKRCHELVEESRPDLMSKHIKVYSRRTAPAQNLLGLGQEDAATSFPTPAQNFRGLGQEEGATKFSAGGYDFTGLGFAADGISLWSSSNVHYPSIPSLPFPILGSVPGPVKSIWEPHQIEHAHRGSGPGRLSALDLLHLAGVVPGL